MNVYFVYKVLTNRIRALRIAAGYITSTQACRDCIFYAVCSTSVMQPKVHYGV